MLSSQEESDSDISGQALAAGCDAVTRSGGAVQSSSSPRINPSANMLLAACSDAAGDFGFVGRQRHGGARVPRMDAPRPHKLAFGQSASAQPSYRTDNFSNRGVRPNSPRPSDGKAMAFNDRLSAGLVGSCSADSTAASPPHAAADRAADEARRIMEARRTRMTARETASPTFDTVEEEPEREDNEASREPVRPAFVDALDLRGLETMEAKGQRSLGAIANAAARAPPAPKGNGMPPPTVPAAKQEAQRPLATLAPTLSRSRALISRLRLLLSDFARWSVSSRGPLGGCFGAAHSKAPVAALPAGMGMPPKPVQQQHAGLGMPPKPMPQQQEGTLALAA